MAWRCCVESSSAPLATDRVALACQAGLYPSHGQSDCTLQLLLSADLALGSALGVEAPDDPGTPLSLANAVSPRRMQLTANDGQPTSSGQPSGPVAPVRDAVSGHLWGPRKENDGQGSEAALPQLQRPVRRTEDPPLVPFI